MPAYRSDTNTVGRGNAAQRALWRATGTREEDFGKPVIAVANSFTQFVPGHVHLREVGKLVAEAVEAAGCQVVKVMCVLDRREGGSDEIRRRGYDFVALLEANEQGEVAAAEGD